MSAAKPNDHAETVARKGRGECIPPEEISRFVCGIANGEVTDAQLGAFTMAVRFMGMGEAERTALTLAMRDSGKVLHWQGLGGPVLDKHSTGGVGDWVSLALAPMVAACGGHVPMISGRGLGHTGGTLDKLESIPGFDVQVGSGKLNELVKANGMAMIGQGPDLAPADGRMYAVRDVTATVESVPLIVSSILSKKLAEGLDGLVLDVKTGNGAFMCGQREARELAQALCATAESAGLRCSALVTDMNQPLGRNAGNALELREALDFLAGHQADPRMQEVIYGLGGEMLRLGGLASSSREARKALRHALDSGEAAERFAAAVAAQGGPSDLFENRDRYLENAPFVQEFRSPASGWVSAIDTRGLGNAVLHLGGGRMHVEDTIDHRVGLSGLCSVGDRVDRGQALCRIHANSEAGWRAAVREVTAALVISEQASAPLPTIYESITGQRTEQ